MDEKTLLFIKEHEHENIKELALQSKRYPNIDMGLVLQQIQGRQIARYKIPFWYEHEQILYPKHISLEQCSSQKTAEYKASLCKGSWLIDLTGGMGVDLSFMSKNFNKATHVEKQAELSVLTKQNYNTLNINNAEFITSSAEEYLVNMNSEADTIYIDPSRRSNSGAKTVLISDCTPNLVEIENIINLKCNQAIIKLSPMLDISHALDSLKTISEVHIVSSNNECKELLFINNKRKEESIKYHCINILNNGDIEKYTFSPDAEISITVNHTNRIGKYLYEPNSAILKAGAYKSIASDYNIDKLHVSSHLYTSDANIKRFPGRSFLVIETILFNKKELKLFSEKIKQANITVRNFPLSVAEIRKRTKIKDGGNIYIFATTLADNNKVLVICEKAE